jgi:hypothetical protein
MSRPAPVDCGNYPFNLVVGVWGSALGTSRGTQVTVIAAAVTMIGAAAGCAEPPRSYLARPAPPSRSSTSAAPVNEINGTYSVVTGDPNEAHPTTWVFTSCGDGCAHVDIPDGNSKDQALARYVANQWTVQLHLNAAIQCGDGTFGPGIAHYTWNPDTLKGRYWARLRRARVRKRGPVRHRSRTSDIDEDPLGHTGCETLCRFLWAPRPNRHRPIASRLRRLN